MKSYIVYLPMMAIEKVIYLKSFWRKHIIWVRVLKNWRLPIQLIIFSYFWAKILKISHPVNYSYLPPWDMSGLGLKEDLGKTIVQQTFQFLAHIIKLINMKLTKVMNQMLFYCYINIKQLVLQVSLFSGRYLCWSDLIMTSILLKLLDAVKLKMLANKVNLAKCTHPPPSTHTHTKDRHIYTHKREVQIELDWVWEV